MLDKEMGDLKTMIKEGFPESCTDLPQEMKKFWDAGKELWIEEEVVLKGEKVVIPLKLHPEFLTILGSAHQGETAMRDRARECVF